jgi:hypothetical protein
MVDPEVGVPNLGPKRTIAFRSVVNVCDRDPRFEITLRHGASRYEIVVENPQSVQRGVAAAELYGATITLRPLAIPLEDDGAVHRLQVSLG